MSFEWLVAIHSNPCLLILFVLLGLCGPLGRMFYKVSKICLSLLKPKKPVYLLVKMFVIYMIPSNLGKGYVCTNCSTLLLRPFGPHFLDTVQALFELVSYQSA